MKIGFIGLGIMGRPMAKNLVKAGYELYVFDMVPKAVEELVAAGATACENNKDVASKSEVVITMLPNSPHCKSAILGENGVIEGKHDGLKVIDMSSIAPLASKEIGEKLAEAGIPMLEAPVSGGEQGAIDGKLSLMCGGDKALFEELKPVLEPMAASIVLCGDIGAGNTTKVINQHIIAVEMAGLAEAFTLCVKAGVDPEVVFEAIRGGAAGSRIMELKIPNLFKRNFEPGFKLDLHTKDMTNALDTAQALGSPMPIGAQVLNLMKVMQGRGHGSDDHTIMMKYYEDIAGVEISGK